MIDVVPPGLILVFGGLLLLFLRGTVRNVALVALPLVALYFIWQVPDGISLTVPYMGYDLILVKGDKLSRLFATIFALMGFAGAVFALNQKNTTELAAAFVYAGSAVSVTFCGDLISLFIFWEIMAVASTIVVMSGGESSLQIGIRYAAVHFLGGVLLMAGIAGEIAATNSIEFAKMSGQFSFQYLFTGQCPPELIGADGKCTGELLTWPRVLILAGFLINAGAPPLSAWLPDAYPAGSWSGTVFLSAFTTKTAVYVLMRGFPGTEILIYIGLYMVFYGIVYAILENDMRRILAYSIINQVGFMVTGIGIGTALTLNGAAGHAFAHIIYKALLLMSAGSVLYVTGKSKCTDLGGLFRTMPLTTICGTIGAFAISAFPWTSGFVTKSMISSGAGYEKMVVVYFLLAAASAGVFLHAGIKFPWFVFFQKDSGLRPPEPPLNMRIAMVFFAFLCIAIGIYPDPLYAILPFEAKYQAYDLNHVVVQLQLLLFSGLAFFLMLGWLKRTLTITLDFDWFYRKFGLLLAREFGILSGHAWGGFTNRVIRLTSRFINRLYDSHGPKGIFARSWPTGSMAFWTTLMLGAYLILYYI